MFDGLQLANSDAILIPCHFNEEFGIFSSIDVDKLLQTIEDYGDDLAGVLLTRPTYQGLTLSAEAMKRIVDLCHSFSVPVIIDEAHGSHLKFLNDSTLRGA